MKVLGSVTGILGIVFDIDNTVYYRTDEYLAAGSHNEVVEVAKILGVEPAEAQRRIAAKRQEIATQQNRKVALTEGVLALGVTRRQWDVLRCTAWNPEKWIQPDSEMSELMRRLADRFTVCFGTNSPSEIGERIIELIGIRSTVPKVLVFGPDNIGHSKPDPQFFSLIAQVAGLDPATCLSIGDREFSEGPPALEAGYAGAIIVPGSRDETLQVGEMLLSRTLSAQTHMEGGVSR
ncbi:MAG: HAD family hydrolase [Candidatus Buchananbacteria bacterium]|nr:HAD family hydrolase [Candidatus Buchananbacteria bacterium]